MFRIGRALGARCTLHQVSLGFNPPIHQIAKSYSYVLFCGSMCSRQMEILCSGHEDLSGLPTKYETYRTGKNVVKKLRIVENGYETHKSPDFSLQTCPSAKRMELISLIYELGKNFILLGF